MPLTHLFSACVALVRVLSKPKPLIKQQKKFLEILEERLKERAIKKEWSEETKRKYRYVYEKTERFLTSKNYDVLPLSELKVPIFEEFRRWMHDPTNIKSCGLTHSSRHLETCVDAMNYAVREGHIEFNPILSLETGRDRRKSIIALDQEELWRWITYDFQNTTFRKVQLLSIFQAATGLSYGNLFDYNTRFDPDTGLWIEDHRKKVGRKPFFIPLDQPEFAIAKAIHVQFDGNLPRLENGTYNRLLKEMAAVVGIKKRLSTHNFRKTFASMMDQDGFELGVICAVMGNTEEVCRDYYIVTSKKKIEKAFRQRQETIAIRSVLAN